MSCEIKNEKCPFQIQCSFSTDANDTQLFSLYFYSSQGSQELVVCCAFNGKPHCFNNNGFETTHKDFNDVTITVPDTFATRAGSFGCQKGEIPMVKNCPYPPPEICNTSSSTASGIGLGTTTIGIHSSLTTEQFGNEGMSPAVPVAAIVVPIVVFVIILFIGGIMLIKKYRSKSREASKISTIYNGCPSVNASEECEKRFLGKKNTGNHVNQTQTDRASASFIGVIIGTENPINRNQVLTVNEQTANVEQEHASTEKISRASSGLQLTPSSSVSRISSTSDISDTPLLSH